MKLTIGALGLALALVAALQNSQEVCCQLDSAQSGSGPGGIGLFKAFLSPLRETLKQAKRLLGNRVSDVENFVHTNFDQLQQQTFKMFAQMYNKTYSPTELPKRMALFFQRRKLIEDSVRAFSEGKLPFLMRENSFVDWDEHELKTLAGSPMPKSIKDLTAEELEVIFGRNKNKQQDSLVQDDTKSNEIEHSDSDGTITIDIDEPALVKSSWSALEANMSVRAPVSIPAHKDWRKSGCVAEPINQGRCGCCYAVATMGVVEAMRCISRVSSPILSAQQVIDCSTKRMGYNNFGCDGGWSTEVMRYLDRVGTAARETCYPLVKRQEYCKLDRVKYTSGCTVSSSISDSAFRYKVLNNERDILYHVANTGPVVTVMRATDRFLYYGSGIFDDPSCSRDKEDVDHAIAIVGYGRENGQDYWLIKNSWGKEWGIDGYGKYKRGSYACSIGHWGWVLLK